MFGSSKGNDLDAIFENHRREMNKVMKSLFSLDLNTNANNASVDNRSDKRLTDTRRTRRRDDMLSSPFGLPDIDKIIHDVKGITSGQGQSNSHSYSSRTVMSMHRGPDGKAQVYQASETVKAAPGGIRETQKALIDTRVGVKKMAIGRHIGERGHVKEKEQNIFSGQMTENEEFINMEETQAPEFSREWHKKTEQFKPAGISKPVTSNRKSKGENVALPSSKSTHGSIGNSSQKDNHQERKSKNSKFQDKFTLQKREK